MMKEVEKGLKKGRGEKVKGDGLECDDVNCFAHGTLKTRGSLAEGIIVSDKPKRTVIVERHFTKFIPKYERYARRSSRIPAHNPDCIGARLGDFVRIAECRKISKTKAWTVVQVLKKSAETEEKGKKKVKKVKQRKESAGG